MNTREIKNRISSIEQTYKITNAMYLIASTKLRKAKSDLDKTKPYFNALKKGIKRIFRINSDIENRYFYPMHSEKPQAKGSACLVITADKGLAGAYNQNVIKATLKLLNEEKDVKLYVVGEYGRHFFTEHHYNIENDFDYTANNPSMHRAREISRKLLDVYDKKEVGKLFIIYTDLKSGMKGEAISNRVLPFHRATFQDLDDKEKVLTNIEYYPDIKTILNNIMPSYITGYIYSALVDSFCCEQEARMTAMSQANDNAKAIISDLKLMYNHVRQSQITQEITEVCGGAKAKLKEEGL